MLACSSVIFDPHPWAVLDALEPKAPMNFTGWGTFSWRDLIGKLQRPGDPAWRELQSLWARNPAALPLLDFQSVIWVDRRLRVEPSPLGLCAPRGGGFGAGSPDAGVPPGSGRMGLPGWPWPLGLQAPAGRRPRRRSSLGALGPALLVVALLSVLAPLLAWLGGPGLADRRPLALLEAPPDLLWAALLLALWPSHWGPPGSRAGCWPFSWLPCRARSGGWRRPCPGSGPSQAWGRAATRRMRRLVLMHLWGRWLAARLPLWLTATLCWSGYWGCPAWARTG
ncbi:MAG: hypothetical protein IPP58_16055 [Holophagaceae bacterium]|uniref:Uncharacterized protein n=1 Tax=Candidatus Geothrix skivensis TaxID=2954439 RepID=A0A9D7SJJ7_9BACT|nr:hypothetical protein [Candidatus Geothrix skivensis]